MVISQRGSAPILLIVVATVFGLGLLASGYLNYVQFQSADQDKREFEGRITDLQYQLKQQPASPSPSPSTSPSPSPSPSPGVLGEQTVAFTQLGAQVATGDPIADLTYEYQAVKSGGVTLAVANLTTRSLMAQYPKCIPGTTSLGQIVRRPLSSKTSASKFIKRLGDYNYYYVAAGGNCTGTTAGLATLNAARTAVINTALPTLAN